MSEFIVLGLGMTLKEAAREPMQWPLQLGQPFRQDSGQALPRSVAGLAWTLCRAAPPIHRLVFMLLPLAG